LPRLQSPGPNFGKALPGLKSVIEEYFYRVYYQAQVVLMDVYEKLTEK
jgi:hypothetical protein